MDNREFERERAEWEAGRARLARQAQIASSVMLLLALAAGGVLIWAVIRLILKFT